MSETYVALLRGVNVGGKNKLPMKELACLFNDAGCDDTRTYIQSGNVVFHTDPRKALGIAESIRREIGKRYSIETRLILRATSDMSRVIKANPFLKEAVEEDFLHVYFLAEPCGKECIAQLDPDRSPPDRFAVRGSEIYLCLPNGMGKTKLGNTYFDKKLKTTSTARNWRTVLKLYEMMQG
jgi:uncharacterized protein (DUF1697 family)